MGYKRWDRIILIESYWGCPPGTKGVINGTVKGIKEVIYEVGLDVGEYIHLREDETEKYIRLESKLHKVLS